MNGIVIDVTLFAYIFSLYFLTYRPGTNLVSNLIAVLLIGLIIIRNFFLRKSVIINPFLIAFFCFTAAAAISCVTALNMTLALNMTKTLLSIFLLVFALTQYIDDIHRIKKVLRYCIYSGFLASLYILFNYRQAENIRLGDVLGNQNNMASIIASALVFALYFVLFEKKYLYFIPSAVMMLTIVFSGSRRAIIFVLLNVAVLLFLKYRKNVRKLITAGTIGAILLIVFFILIMNVPSLYKIIGIRFQHVVDFVVGKPITKEYSIPKRTFMYYYGLDLFQKRPVQGYGANNYRVLLEQVKGWKTYSHSNVIEILTGMGLVGAFAYYAIFGCVIWKLRKLHGSMQSLFFAWTLSSLVIEVVNVQYYSKLFYVVLALGAVVGSNTGGHRGTVLLCQRFWTQKNRPPVSPCPPLRVGILSETLSRGGTEKVAADISRYLPNSYEKVFILYDGSQVSYPYDGTMIDLRSNPSGQVFGKLFIILKRAWEIAGIKEKYQFDVVLSLMDSCNIFNILTRQNEKVIVSVRNDLLANSQNIYKKIHASFLKYLYRDADMVVAVSREIGDELIERYGIQKNKLKVIYNGYDLERTQGDTGGRFSCVNVFGHKRTVPLCRPSPCVPSVIVTSGRLTRQKGQWHLIRAFGKVRAVIQDARLTILGQGELETELKLLAQNMGLEDCIDFLGFQQNPYPYIRKASVFVLPSLYEGFPNVLAEAMACGTPVISCDCSTGPREILAPDTDYRIKTTAIEFAKYGVLVPVCSGLAPVLAHRPTVYRPEEHGLAAQQELETEEEILADAMLKILRDSQLRNHYADMAAERVRDFDIKNTILQWQEAMGGMM